MPRSRSRSLSRGSGRRRRGREEDRDYDRNRKRRERSRSSGRHREGDGRRKHSHRDDLRKGKKAARRDGSYDDDEKFSGRRRQRPSPSLSSSSSSSLSPPRGTDKASKGGLHHKPQSTHFTSRPSPLEQRILDEEVIRRFDSRIKEQLEEKVSVYCESSEFQKLLEDMKKRKREEMLNRIDQDIRAEREAVLDLERKRAEAEAEEKRKLAQVLEENRRKVEEQRRLEMEEKERQDEQKLLEIQRRQQMEEEEEKRRVRGVQATVTGTGPRTAPSALFTLPHAPLLRARMFPFLIVESSTPGRANGRHGTRLPAEGLPSWWLTQRGASHGATSTEFVRGHRRNRVQVVPALLII
ncbi:hypothetical protein Naga_100039g28 [Nannochloropsis gaditana]|uniref:Arginine and glutamate-rich protein 1 n=1 Tax=Nannochloropsis gaditana TaxID=72520 RepID=W7T4X9_9STRA|nr:hypothetical protein Naga_100039g28 [Nannochloropsis gaditana]